MIKLINILKEIKITPPKEGPYNHYKEKIDSLFDSRFHHEFHQYPSENDIELFFSTYDDNIYSIFEQFILNHMIRNNYEIDGQIVTYNSQIDENDIKKYLKLNYKLKLSLTDLAYKFYSSKLQIVKQEIKQKVIQKINNAHPDTFEGNTLPWNNIYWDIAHIIDNILQTSESGFIQDIIHDYSDEFEDYLLDKFHLKPLEEIKITSPFQYEKAYGESHSYSEYKKNLEELSQYPDNYLIDLEKGKIIASFTGWNIARWSRAAEEANREKYDLVSRSALRNLSDYRNLPNIDVDDSNSWESSNVALSLVQTYSVDK